MLGEVVGKLISHRKTAMQITSVPPKTNFNNREQWHENRCFAKNMNIYSPETAVILIVDDNPINLSVLSQTLLSEGFQVRVAIDGENALDQVSYELPDLILLDVEMPVLNGFETCEQLKANPLTRDIPVVFMTALADTTNKVKGLAVGAVDYITKPFQEQELLARVKVHLKLSFVVQQLQEANFKLEQIANLDGLTQVANRRRFDQYIDQEWRRLAREQQPLSLILCDVDYFKLYNDNYGHQAGDTCLKGVAQAINSALKRPADLLARYGGEEFVLVLPNTKLSGATQLADLVTEEVRRLQIPHARSDVSEYVTLSMGISSEIPHPDMLPNTLIEKADQALYQAKKRGRNQYYVDA